MDSDMLDNIPTQAQIQEVEQSFDDIETELIRHQAKISVDAYKKRADLIERIPHFWTVVFENPPEEITSWINLQDAEAMSSLIDFSVNRFDIEASPRSFNLVFTFKENSLFEDTILEKKFSYRHSTDGWCGLVSEPVTIKWKPGKDLTHGLLDASADLFKAETRERESTGTDYLTATDREALPEHGKLKKMLRKMNEQASFFTFFGYISETRYITPQESNNAIQKLRSRSQTKGEEGGDDSDDDSDNGDDLLDVEICSYGSSIASILAEDLWPNAFRFYAAAFEAEGDVELGTDDETGSEVEEDDNDDEPPQLIKKRGGSPSARSPAKFPKTTDNA